MAPLAEALGVKDYFMIVLIVAFTLVGLILAWAMVKLGTVMASLKESVERHTNETVIVVHEVGNTVKGVNNEIERVDSIIASAQNVAQNASTISETVKLAVTNPLVKALAFFAGARRASKKFRDE